MDRNVTVSVRGLLVTAVALLALLAAYLLGSAGGSPAAPAQATPAAAERPVREDVRTLRMVGAGEATVVPDQLTFSLSVTDKELALDDALADSSATMKRVLAALADDGVRAADVQTTGLQMYPEYDYPYYGPPVLTGYRVTQRALVKVRELSDGGRAVSTAVATGGNGVRVTNIRLGISDPEAAIGRGARRRRRGGHRQGRAVRRGDRAGARSGAEPAGARQRHPGTQQRAACRGVPGAARDLAELPVRAGRDELSVRVEVQWAFE